MLLSGLRGVAAWCIGQPGGGAGLGGAGAGVALAWCIGQPGGGLVAEVSFPGDIVCMLLLVM
jgi:hypothetical protein